MELNEILKLNDFCCINMMQYLGKVMNMYAVHLFKQVSRSLVKGNLYKIVFFYQVNVQLLRFVPGAVDSEIN